MDFESLCIVSLSFGEGLWAVCMQSSVTSLCWEGGTAVERRHCTAVESAARQTTNNGAIEAMFRFTLWLRQKEEIFNFNIK